MNAVTIYKLIKIAK